MAEELRDDVNEAIVLAIKNLIENIMEKIKEERSKEENSNLSERQIFKNTIEEFKEKIQEIENKLQELGKNRSLKDFFVKETYKNVNHYSSEYDKYHNLMMEEMKAIKDKLDLSNPKDVKTLDNLNKIEKMLLENRGNKNILLEQIETLKSGMEYSNEEQMDNKNESSIEDELGDIEEDSQSPIEKYDWRSEDQLKAHDRGDKPEGISKSEFGNNQWYQGTDQDPFSLSKNKSLFNNNKTQSLEQMENVRMLRDLEKAGYDVESIQSEKELRKVHKNFEQNIEKPSLSDENRLPNTPQDPDGKGNKNKDMEMKMAEPEFELELGD